MRSMDTIRSIRLASLGRFRVSRYVLAKVGLLVFMYGVTASSFIYGAQSIQYYFFVLLGFLACVPLIVLGLQNNQVMTRALLFAFLPLLLYVLQALWHQDYDLMGRVPLLYLGSVIAVLMAIATGLLDERSFRSLMYWVAIGHILIAIYGIQHWNPILTERNLARFSALGLREAVWAELMVGAFLAALLSGQRWLIAVATIVAGVVIFGTQMRGFGLALALSLMAFIFYRINQNKLLIVIVGLGLAIALGAVYFDSIYRFVFSVLLLDDPYRGLDSGFSGRFNNWQAGLEKFSETPLIGVGLYDPVASYTHSGYLKAFAQFGVIYGLLFLGILFIAFKRSLHLMRADLIAGVVCYCVFIASSPRYINFQLMPFVGMAAIAYIFLEKNSILRVEKIKGTSISETRT
jgi:O-antigen ligase